MKLNILSDLHLGVAGMERPRNDADVVILAGDIARPERACEFALGFDKPVLYVPGNHEFYGASLDATVAELRSRCEGSHVHVLHDDEIVIDGVRFLGSTLWTDFMLFGEEGRATAVSAALQFMRDFSRIRVDDASDRAFHPDDCAERYARHSAWLASRLAQPHDGPSVVITHHAPSPRSIHPRFAGSPINACFISDTGALLADGGAALWIHGHTHDGFDYLEGTTRVVCNPRGYVKDGVNENAGFDPDFIVEL